jgi:hypothetical protein
MRRRSALVALAAVAVLMTGCGTATLLPDGRVLLRDVVAKQYDPATGSVTNLPAPPTVRAYDTATLLQDGRVLIAGGATGIGTGLDGSAPTLLGTAELYDPATGTYAPTGSMVHARAYHTATLLQDGRVLIQGGGGSEEASGGVPTVDSMAAPEMYDPATGTFSALAATTSIPMVWSTATLLQDGRVLIAGGITLAEPDPDATADPDGDGSPDGVPTAHAELFDPATGTFTPTGDMTMARVWHTATPLDDGRVLMVGGTKNVDLNDSSDTLDPTTQTAELYDPATGTFTATTSTPTASRLGAAAALLDDQRVLITGGVESDSATPTSLERSAELFDAQTNTFTATGDMVGGHAFHTATPVGAGKVLIAGFGDEVMTGVGGSTPDLLSSAELYDEASGTFEAIPVEPAVLPSASPSGG